MNLPKRIDEDCRCLESYFHKKFDLLQVALAEDAAAPIEVQDASATESQVTYHGFSRFI